MPVPPGFIVSTDTSLEYLRSEKKKDIIDQVLSQCRKEISSMEKRVDAVFGLDQTISDKKLEVKHEVLSKFKDEINSLQKQTDSSQNNPAIPEVVNTLKMPLLVSIRSCASVSLPGTLDSVMNLGINDRVVLVMAEVSGNPRWAYDTYRRFIQMYGALVLHVDRQKYEDILTRVKRDNGVEKDSCLDVAALQQITREFKTFTMVPECPFEQLVNTIQAIYCSWSSHDSIKHREMHGLSGDMGTAVIVQAMVFGNLNDQSGTGVVVSRNPSTGERDVWGEYCPNALGQDISDGSRTPDSIQKLHDTNKDLYDAVVHFSSVLEKHFKKVQTVEFTIQSGKVYLVNAYTTPLTATAAVRVAVSMVNAKQLTEREALLRIDPHQMSYFLHPVIDANFGNMQEIQKRILGVGQAASPGTATGKIVFSGEESEACKQKREDCILVRSDTSVDDFAGLRDAKGALTVFGGVTAHAAALMRSLNKPVVIGVSGLKLDTDKKELSNEDGSHVLHSGDVITIDGSTGTVYLGAIPFVTSVPDPDFLTVLKWADKYKKVHVHAAVGSHFNLEKALEYGAEGVGLFKTEHMFYQQGRIDLFQQVILSDDAEERKEPLEKLRREFVGQFVELFRSVNGHGPVRIRLLNESLSIFLPSSSFMSSDHFDKAVKDIADRMGISADDCHKRIMKRLASSGPSNLGLRGSALSLVYPDIFEMQIRAVAAAILDARSQGIQLYPSVVVPLKGTQQEINLMLCLLRDTLKSFCERESSFTVEYLNLSIGCMIEAPAGCTFADKLVSPQEIDFVGFDSNDITELMFGISRRVSHLNRAKCGYQHQICAKDPFEQLEMTSVGPMLQSAVTGVKKVNRNTEVTVYGDQCSDKCSLRFLSHIGVDSVCVEPLLVPIVKIAAAQGKILDDAGNDSAGLMSSAGGFFKSLTSFGRS
eukprot:gene26345-32911_t